MLDVRRHAWWVCASLIRSRVEPCEVGVCESDKVTQGAMRGGCVRVWSGHARSHARWVFASLIRSRVGPCEMCVYQVSFSYYAVDPGLKIYFIKDRSTIKSTVNKGQRKLSKKGAPADSSKSSFVKWPFVVSFQWSPRFSWHLRAEQHRASQFSHFREPGIQGILD